MTGRVLAIDGGKSQTRAVVVEDGVVVGEATGEGFVYPPGRSAEDEIVRIVDATLRALPARAREAPDSAVLALTGCPDDPAALGTIRRAVAADTGAAEVVVVGDVVAAHAGRLGAPGVVVVAGTGAIALAVAEDATAHRADGWGPVLGDAGGGYAVGRAGLRAAYAAADGRGEATLLCTEAAELLGGVNLDAARRLLGRPDLVPLVSSFAINVTRAAERGDRVAAAILADAAGALAVTASAAARAAGMTASTPVTWAGRLFDAGPVLLEPFRTAVRASGLVPVQPRGSALDGALLLATRPALYAAFAPARTVSARERGSG